MCFGWGCLTTFIFWVKLMIQVSPIRSCLETFIGTIRENRLPFHWGSSETRWKSSVHDPLGCLMGRSCLNEANREAEPEKARRPGQKASLEHLDPADSEASSAFPTPLRLFNYASQPICYLCSSRFELVFSFHTTMIQCFSVLHSVSPPHNFSVW